MRCRKFQNLALLYLDGQMPPAQAAEAKRHVDECVSCSQYLQRTASFESLLRSSVGGEQTVPASLDARVMDAVSGLNKNAGRQSAGMNNGGSRRTMSAAAAFGLAALGFVAGRVSSRQAAVLPPLSVENLYSVTRSVPVVLRAASSQSLSLQMQQATSIPVKVVDLLPEGAELLSAERLSLNGVPVACLRYRYLGREARFYEMAAGALRPPGIGSETEGADSYVARREQGVTYIAWRAGAINCVLAARATPMHELFHLACHACEKQEGLL